MFNLPIPPLPLPDMSLTTPIALPVGTVVAFAGNIASSPTDAPSDYTTNIEALGWMLCDGRACEVSKYPELFAVLGYLYGGENGQFNIPNYRGLFLRGVDGNTGRDPDASKRTPSKNGTKEGVGSQQEDALQSHQHQYNKVPETTTLMQPEKGVPAIAPLPQLGLTSEATDSLSPPGNVRTSQETRPKNVYVYYIIKYTYG